MKKASTQTTSIYLLLLILSITTTPKLIAQSTEKEAIEVNTTAATPMHFCTNGSIDLIFNKGFEPFDVIWVKIEDGVETTVQVASKIDRNTGEEDLLNATTGTYKFYATDALCGTAEQEIEIKCEGDALLEEGTNHSTFIQLKKPIIYPNPFISTITITMNDLEDDFFGQIILLDHLGRVQRIQPHEFIQGINQIQITDLDQLPTGTYLLTVQENGSMIYSKKIVKVTN